MQNTYRIGNAQTIGSRQIQSNYFSTREDGFLLAVLADGTIDHINGRRCAVLAVEACMQEFFVQRENTEIFLGNEVFVTFIDALAVKIQKDIREYIYTGKTPNLSLSLLAVRDRKLFYYTVGNNQAFLYDGKDYRLFNGRNGQADFGEGMTAGIISAGVWEALQEKEMVSCLKKKGHPFDKAQQIILGVRKKNRKKAGNATAILIEDAL
ncbi:hypothetical protein D7V86_22300 [bacterium D16-51]|nr:hypothetical protein D7V96_14205 [bacterium D16-59]RKI55135.1 hypothetical protein D7V86_22300 [bacterium D16-51]